MRDGEPNSEITASLKSGAIRVAIIEDQPAIREGLGILINGTDGYYCTAGFSSMEEALGRIGEELPDVALVDIELPGISGIDGIRLLKERYPQLLLMALTIYGDDDRIFDALCAGAAGYLLKKTPPARVDYHLTPHETRLLKLLVEGHSYKTAAAELNSTVNTISFHVRSIYAKLQVHSKSEAAVKALRNQLL